MTCDDVRSQLTAYLDGELEGDRGSAVRGHLRTCQACRDISADEAALRDGLRALPTVDPSPALWAGIQRRLAEEEVADAERPAWRRSLARFVARWRPLAPQLALGSAALAAAVVVLALHARERRQPVAEPAPVAPVASAVAPKAAPLPATGDVVGELAADAAQATASYRQAAEELVGAAMAERATWPEDRRQAFDEKLAGFRKAADAANGRAKDKVYRAMTRYLQGVAIRDEVTLNDRKLANGGLP